MIRIRIGHDAATTEKAEWLCPLEHSPPTGKKIQLLTFAGTACYGKWDWDGGFIAWAPCIQVPERFKNRIGKLPNWVELRYNYEQPK